MLEQHIYPLAFIWKSDLWTTLTNILEDALRRRRPEGPLDAAKDFMLDRLDDALEPLVRHLVGKASWDEMKENALAATEDAEGGLRQTLRLLAEELDEDVEIHLAAHSAGAILQAPLVSMLTGELGRTIKTSTLWAPASTVDLFKEHFVPAIESGGIEQFALFTLNDEAEQDDHCANIYHKSLLYLVANAFEDPARIPLVQDGAPILGMERSVRDDSELLALFEADRADWVLSPNSEPVGSPDASRAIHHGDFDDDAATVRATLARITASSRAERDVAFGRSASRLASVRRLLPG